MKFLIKTAIFVLVLSLILSSCGRVGQIADSVLDAAAAELKNQVKQVLEENKLQVIEIKTAFGKLNDSGSKYQFFIAALVKSDATGIPNAAADGMNKIFTEAGLNEQTTPNLVNSHLVHKEITFKHTDYTEGEYYVIWGYMGDLTIDLPNFDEIKEKFGK